MRHRTLALTTAVNTALTGAALALTSGTASADARPPVELAGMQHMQGVMADHDPGMQRMQELMADGNLGMRRMHELMADGNPGMQRMHHRMVTGPGTCAPHSH